MKSLQLITYTQCNQARLDPNVDEYLFVVSTGAVRTGTSAGSLDLHTISKVTEYAIGYDFIQELKYAGKHAHFLVGGSYANVLGAFCENHHINHIIMMEHNEPYLHSHLCGVFESLQIDYTIKPNTQFFIDHQTFQEHFKKPPVMETFYRRMRNKTGILMKEGAPEGGERNYDKHNRKFDKTFTDVEHRTFYATDGWQQAIQFYQKEIADRGHELPSHIPTTHSKAQALLSFFVENLLDRFGELEDAMYDTSDFVYHSLLSIAINFGLLTPQEVVEAVAQANTAINNKEGFIRQVLGWREYMYHRFQYYKDSIYDENSFNHTTPLPEYFWKPQQSPHEMNCVNSVLKKVDRIGYSHHIERLMVIGNFTLLMGYNPHDVNKWFREQYTDAFERVVTPNVLGMSQYADGGNLATKPYVSSANYINKMSNYCKGCKYNHKEKTGEDACPLNSLYRKFVDTHQELFKKRGQGFLLNHLKNINMDEMNQQVKTFRDLPTTPYEGR